MNKELKRDKIMFLDYMNKITTTQNKKDMLLLLANRCLENDHNIVVELDNSGLFINHFDSNDLRIKSFEITIEEEVIEAFEYLEKLYIEAEEE